MFSTRVDRDVREKAQQVEYLALRPQAWKAFLKSLQSVKGDALEGLLHDVSKKSH